MLRTTLSKASSRGLLLMGVQQAGWVPCAQLSLCSVPDVAFMESSKASSTPATFGAPWAPWAAPRRSIHGSPLNQEQGGPAAEEAVASSAAQLAVAQPQESSTALVEFTPDQSALGGALIGLAAASKLGFTGRVLGVSGILGGLLRGDTSAWRLAWLGGLASGALALTVIQPAAFPTLTDSYSLLRAASAGLLVGLGTSLGSGCTSGHGICGLSRLAPRSLAATGCFMVSGAAAAALTGTMAAAGADVGSATSLVLMGPEQWRLGGSLLVGSLATLGALRVLPSLGVPKAAVGHLSEAATGAIFALGLGLSGMLQPAKVAGFLSPLLPAWDPSLAFVMGGALAVSLPAFQLIKRRRAAPLCAVAFSLPTKSAVDKPLLAGSALFGAGWGLGGVCPGPGLVSLASPTPQLATLVAAMCVGMYLHRHLVPLYDRVLGGSESGIKRAEAEEPPVGGLGQSAAPKCDG